MLKGLLYPFMWAYAIAIRLRNFFYDRGWRKSFEFDFPVINVGNLSVGGTGKTPHIEYLIRLYLKHNRQPAVLSKGYGRKTSGYRMASATDNAKTIGDEPAQIKRKFPEVTVVVAPNRAQAIPLLLAEAPDTDVILLDDAYQHRIIKPGLNLLLTPWHEPFWEDKLLPVGRLREPWREQKRADAVIVTKCPGGFTVHGLPAGQEGSQFTATLTRPEHEIYLTTQRYGAPYHLVSVPPYQGGQGGVAVVNSDTDVLLVCAIADPQPLIDHIRPQAKSLTVMRFRDHHYYTKRDVGKLRAAFGKIDSSKKIIVTTEKDATRLALIDEDWSQWPMYVQPVEVAIVEGEERFDQMVLNYCREANQSA